MAHSTKEARTGRVPQLQPYGVDGLCRGAIETRLERGEHMLRVRTHWICGAIFHEIDGRSMPLAHRFCSTVPTRWLALLVELHAQRLIAIDPPFGDPDLVVTRVRAGGGSSLATRLTDRRIRQELITELSFHVITGTGPAVLTVKHAHVDRILEDLALLAEPWSRR